MESKQPSPKTLLEDSDNGFSFTRHNPRPPKPRRISVTETRGRYYSVMGPSYLSGVPKTMGAHIGGLKFGGGSLPLFPELAHAHGVYASMGESSAAAAAAVVDRYLAKCRARGFDVIKISTAGLTPKPELGIQFGAGGDTEAGELESMGTSDPLRVINTTRRFVDMGVERMVIESEGITENVRQWRTDVIQAILRVLPMGKVMFEAAEPKVFNWYIREFGVDVNFCLRSGIWGTADTFGKIVTYRPEGK
ncbi:uncharacterized protein K441DRAFT_709261 [Cenococcum geophilum 1.58]|uniref:Uncharacterized protein n=1 Tax=Cenococcum geophilum 1.58 TaxID=794803 RepID=A0ACC8EMJ3_9PEZI|nr:hypothetical protein K441DRAFT_709261 [Cenococcum geophilum 1.58]